MLLLPGLASGHATLVPEDIESAWLGAGSPRLRLTSQLASLELELESLNVHHPRQPTANEPQQSQHAARRRAVRHARPPTLERARRPAPEREDEGLMPASPARLAENTAQENPVQQTTARKELMQQQEQCSMHIFIYPLGERFHRMLPGVFAADVGLPLTGMPSDLGTLVNSSQVR